MSGRRVLVCGGRDFSDFRRLYEILDGYAIAEMCHGAARGADFCAGGWAQERSVPCRAFPADWNRYGKAAGAIRNWQMLVEFKPDLVIAFSGGRGTANMVKLAQREGLDVVEVSA